MKKIFLISLLTCVFFIGVATQARAQIAVSSGDIATSSSNTVTSQKLPNPLGITDVNALIARVINFVLSLVGSVSLLMFVYGGLTWMTSAGSSEKIKKGRDIIVWSVIGLAIVFSSYILVKFVVTSLVG